MVEEYHDEYLHMMVDCKTGDHNLDKAIEMAVKGYVYLIVYCIQTDKFGEFLDKMEDI